VRGVPKPNRFPARLYRRGETTEQADQQDDGAMEDESEAILVGHERLLVCQEFLRSPFESPRDRLRGSVGDVEHRPDGGADGLEQLIEDRPIGHCAAPLREWIATLRQPNRLAWWRRRRSIGVRTVVRRRRLRFTRFVAFSHSHAPLHRWTCR
jgi:hypothetical protein